MQIPWKGGEREKLPVLESTNYKIEKAYILENVSIRIYRSRKSPYQCILID